jgi:hypothetical protein
VCKVPHWNAMQLHQFQQPHDISTNNTKQDTRSCTVSGDSVLISLICLNSRETGYVYRDRSHTTASQSQDCRRDDSTKRRLLSRFHISVTLAIHNVRATVHVVTLSLITTDTNLCIPTQCVYIIPHVFFREDPMMA